MRKLVYIFLLFVFFTDIYAATQPKFLIIPTTAVDITIDNTSEIILQYQVTNQTAITRQLTMVPISGIDQVVIGPNVCANPFTLAQGQSCLLTLKARGSALNVGTTNVAVEVCKTQINQNTPDPFLCSKTSSSNNLNIRVKIRPRISVTPRILQLTASGASADLLVTNLSSSDTATNIKAFIDNTTLSGNVTLHEESCASVDPGGTCHITFTPGSTAVSLTYFKVQGENTLPTVAAASISSPTTAQLSVSGSPLELTVDGAPGTLTVNNLSSTVTASNVKAQLSPSMLSSVTQDASDCVSLAAGGSCHLIFHPQSVALSPTSINISGDNSSVTSAIISVSSSTQAELIITSTLPLTLLADGSTTGTMSIFNNSTSIKAETVNADFSGTQLDGNVTASECASIDPQTSCTMTFKPGYNTVVPTSFPIYGKNTTTVTGQLGISSYYLYFTNFLNTSGSVVRCSLSPSNGALSSCSTVAPSLNWPSGIAFNQDGTYAYISVGSPPGVTVCQVISGGLSNCKTTTLELSTASFTEGIAYNSENNVIYVTTSSNNLYKCSLTSSSAINICAIQPTSSTLSFPMGIAINPLATFAYIANYENSTASITNCTISSVDGALSACATNAGVGSYLLGISINPANTLIYYSGYNSHSVNWATVNSNGSVTFSGDILLSDFDYPSGLTFNGATNYIYVGSVSSQKVYQCTVDSSSGSVTGCIDTGASPANFPWGVGLYPNPP